MVKKILLGLVGVLVLLIIVGFFLPGKLEVSRSMVVNAPPEYAFEEVNALENWNKWSYWNTLDTAMTIEYGDKRSGAGASYSWQSAELGNGRATISESVPFSSINADLDFMENGIAKAWYKFEPEGEGTKVTMSFSSDVGYNPFGRWMNLMLIEPAIAESFDYGLNKLKALAEAKPKFTVPITIENTSPVSYIGISHTMSPQDMEAVVAQMDKMYMELYAALKKSKVEPAGPPFCLFPSYSSESMEMVTALPVPSGAKLPAKYKVMKTTGGRAVKAVHTGDYPKLEDTHHQIDAFIEFRNLQLNNSPWEVYVVSPATEKDPNKFVTEVYYPVQ